MNLLEAFSNLMGGLQASHPCRPHGTLVISTPLVALQAKTVTVPPTESGEGDPGQVTRIAEEFIRLHEAGQATDLDEFCGRYPEKQRRPFTPRDSDPESAPGSRPLLRKPRPPGDRSATPGPRAHD